MVADPKQWVSPDEYLRLERLAETKSEYVDGVVLATAGASPRHVAITGNVFSELHQQLKGATCRAYSQDLRVHIRESGMYAYPDVVVVCGDEEFDERDVDSLLNPTLIVEVLSPSTEACDRGRKFDHYKERASLQEYVLVAQDRVSLHRYSRQGEQWLLTAVTRLDDVIELPSIGCTLALRDVYDRVEELSDARSRDGSRDGQGGER